MSNERQTAMFTKYNLPSVLKREKTVFELMSPEARRAMLLTHEQTRSDKSTVSRPRMMKSDTSLASRPRKVINPTSISTHTIINAERSRQGAKSTKNARQSLSNSKRSGPSALVVTPSTKSQPTSRSRSTLSHTDRVSDRTESVQRLGHTGPSPHEEQLRQTTTNSNSFIGTSERGCNDHKDNNTNTAIDDETNKDKPNYAFDDAGSCRVEEVRSKYGSDNEGREHNPEDGCIHSDSYALTLNRALEGNGVMRLRGDITGGAAISEPGTVRALNGGRLTNAQEIVVNVCHDDNRELVFHDDDKESMDNAKTISQIRIDIWLTYNEKFHPAECAPAEELDTWPICPGENAKSPKPPPCEKKCFGERTMSSLKLESIKNNVCRPLTNTNSRRKTISVKHGSNNSNNRNMKTNIQRQNAPEKQSKT